MWQCRSCGATLQHEAVCAACGWPIEESLLVIRRKARGVRLRRPVSDRWVWRGAKAGLILGLALSAIPLACFLIINFAGHRSWKAKIDNLLTAVTVLVLVPFFLALLFASIFLVYGSLIRPIFVALFYSPKRFEQEYGSARKP